MCVTGCGNVFQQNSGGGGIVAGGGGPGVGDANDADDGGPPAPPPPSPSVTGMVISTTPARTVYGLSETIDRSTMSITVNFSDGTTITRNPAAAELSPNTAPASSTTGEPVTITVGSFTDQFTIDVYPVVQNLSGVWVYTGYASLDDACNYNSGAFADDGSIIRA
jgi:hypothetical protein